MLTVKKLLVLAIALLSIKSLVAQPQSVKDSLLLEKAFKNKDGQLVEDLLNRWHREDLSVKDTEVADTALLVKKIYETFINKFLQKEMQGYYSYRDLKPDGSSYGGRGLCHFSLQNAPFIFLQDQLQYTYTAFDITEADFVDYIKWKTNDNGLMPKSVNNPDKLYALDGQKYERERSEPRLVKTISYAPSKDFWEQLSVDHGYKAVLYRYNTERQKRLVRFIGYNAMGPGYIFAFNAKDENSVAYKEREARLSFLNSILQFDSQLTEILAGNYCFVINSIEFIAGEALVLVKYRVGACFYQALFDLKRIDDTGYVPLSVFKAIE